MAAHDVHDLIPARDALIVHRDNLVARLHSGAGCGTSAYDTADDWLQHGLVARETDHAQEISVQVGWAQT